MSHCGSAELVFKESKKALEWLSLDMSNKTVEFYQCSAEVLKRAEQEIEISEENRNVNHLFYTDKNYPEQSKTLHGFSHKYLFIKESMNWNKQKVYFYCWNQKMHSIWKRIYRKYSE